ncbi:MAG: PEGA domain-containing protein [Phycisphaerales bacterium]|nr:PEGA domain-containing protein [Phycisphaerales bacterium]
MLRMVCLFLLLTAGCVQRSLSIDSDPPGALVYLNGQEAGRTPFVKDFTWYGTYEVVVRKEGFQTLRIREPVIAPWWQWPPFDLFAELFPLKDERTLKYTLAPAADATIDLDAILSRSQELQGKLESSRAPRPARP